MMVKRAWMAGLALLAGSALAGEAAAQGGLVAMVEQVIAGQPDLGELEMLETDRVLTLARGDEIVVSYIDSCVRETIAGPGEVRIGSERSRLGEQMLRGRETVECQGTTDKVLGSGPAAAMRLRSITKPTQAAAPRDDGAARAALMRAMRDRQAPGSDLDPPGAAPHRLPVLVLDDPAAEVVLQPLDNQGKPRRVRATEPLVDTEGRTGPLEPGRWLARRGSSALLFVVGGDAADGSADRAQRLVRF